MRIIYLYQTFELFGLFMVWLRTTFYAEMCGGDDLHFECRLRVRHIQN